MILFEKNFGKVIALEEGVVAQLAVFTTDPKIEYITENAIITAMSLTEQTNSQFLTTIGGRVYIYNFGDKLGQFGISGVGFHNGKCDDENKPEISGLEGTLAWYRKNKTSRRQTPITIAIGNIPIAGFIISYTGQITDTQSGLQQWAMSLYTLPEL
jgi:hypothetical protein